MSRESLILKLKRSIQNLDKTPIEKRKGIYENLIKFAEVHPQKVKIVIYALLVTSSTSVSSGGPLLSLVEPQRFIITRVYLTHYCKAKTDFVLLANKRWLGGESIKSLAQFFGLKEQTVKGYLWKLKNEPRFKTFYQQGTNE